MAKTRKPPAKGSKPARTRTSKTPTATKAKAASSAAKISSDTMNGNGMNGDCGNGKMRCKSLIIDGTKYRTRLNHKFEQRRMWESPDSRKLTSSIPGTILKILVEEGQEVSEGDQMLILEAMKMKNRIMFHEAGTVKSIHVSEGEKVPKGRLIVEMK